MTKNKKKKIVSKKVCALKYKQKVFSNELSTEPEFVDL